MTPTAYKNSIHVVAHRPPGLLAWTIYGFFYAVGLAIATVIAVAYGLCLGAQWFYRQAMRPR